MEAIKTAIMIFFLLQKHCFSIADGLINDLFGSQFVVGDVPMDCANRK